MNKHPLVPVTKQYTEKYGQFVAMFMKTGLNNIVCCPNFSQSSTILFNIVTLDSGSAISFNVVDNYYEQRWQPHIVQSSYTAGSKFTLLCTLECFLLE